jgi:ribonuclease P protein component
MNETDESLPKREILRRRTDFDALFHSGKRWHGKRVQVVYEKTGRRQVAFLVPKRVGKAVLRNRIRRWMKEIYRRRRRFLAQYRIAILAKPEARHTGYQDLLKEFETFLDDVIEG